MKKTNPIFKRITSLILSVVFVLSAFATIDFSKPIEALADNQEYYLFSYFTGNNDTRYTSSASQGMRFAVSSDGINFTPVNDNKPVITQTGGTYNCRDPYAFKGQDGYYYIIATDLNVAETSFWGNQQKLVLWRSTDLVNWTDETYINVAEICGLANNQVYRTWAPQVLWDEESSKYMVYFAFAAEGYNSTTMYYMMTDDLLNQSHYSTPQQLYRPADDEFNPSSKDAIDSDITYQDGVYYMFFKDEGMDTVSLATSFSATGPYDYVGKLNSSGSTGGLEGCEVYKIDNDYILVADRYGDAGNFVIYNLGDDLSQISATDGLINVNDGAPITTVDARLGMGNVEARHGSIMHISRAEYNAIIEEWGCDFVDENDITYGFRNAYSISGSDNGAAYSSRRDYCGHTIDYQAKGNGDNGQVKVSEDNGYVTFYNACAFVNDPTILSMIKSGTFTVSFDFIRNASTYTSKTAIFALASNTTDYVMLRGDGKFYVGGNEICSVDITNGIEYSFSIVSDGAHISLFANGAYIDTADYEIAETFPSSGTRYLSLGGSDTAKDGANPGKYIRATYSKLRIRNNAIEDAQAIGETLQTNPIFTANAGESSFGDRNNVTAAISGSTSVGTKPATTYTMAYTLSAWVNVGANVDSDAALFEIGNEGNIANTRRFLTITEDGKLYFRYGIAGGEQKCNVTDIFNGTTLSANTWYFLTVNFYPDLRYGNIWDKMTVKLNGGTTSSKSIEPAYNSVSGSLDNSNYKITNYLRNSFDVRIGGGAGEFTTASNSYVDDVRIYEHAISASELYTTAINEYNAEVALEGLEYEDYVKGNLHNYNPANHAANRKAYYFEDEALNGYSNVVAAAAPSSTYSTDKDSGASTVYGAMTTDNGVTYTQYLPSKIALVYDGINRPGIPVMFSYTDSRSDNYGVNTMFAINGTSTNTSNPDWSFRHYWTGVYATNSNPYKTWIGGSLPYPGTIDMPTNESGNGGKAEIQNLSGYEFLGYYNGSKYDYVGPLANTGKTRYYWNILYFIGSVNTENYYHKLTSIPFESYQWTHRVHTTVEEEIYIINYQPIYDMVKDGSTYNFGSSGSTLESYYDTNIYDNESYYTRASLGQFYGVANAVLKANPMEISEATYRSDMATASATAGQNIKNAISVVGTYNVNSLKRATSFSTVDANYSDALEIVETLGTGSQIYTTEAIKKLREVLSNLKYATSNTLFRAYADYDTYQSEINDEATLISDAITECRSHLLASNVSTLSTARTNGVNKLIELEASNTATYTKASVDALINAVVAAEIELDKGNSLEASDESSIATLAENVSSAITGLSRVADRDFTAYDSAINKLKNLDNDLYEYESDEQLNSIIESLSVATGEEVKYIDESGVTHIIPTMSASVSQTFIDRMANIALSSLNNHIKTYDINLAEGSYSNEVEPVTSDGKFSGTINSVTSGVKYTGTANTKAVITASTADTAWYMSYTSNVTSRTKQYQGYGQEFSTTVIGDMNIYAVQRDEDSAPYKVTIKREYVDHNNSSMPVQCIDFSAASYELPAAPLIPFYTFDGYYLNEEKIEDSSVSISGDTTIIAKYNFDPLADLYDITIQDLSGDTVETMEDTPYNTRLELEGPEGTTAWVETPENGSERLIYIGKDTPYYVTESVTLKPVSTYSGYSVPNVNLKYSDCVVASVDATHNKFIFNGQLVDGGYSVVEYGILIGKSTGEYALKDDDVVLENTGDQGDFKVFRAKSTKLVGANQFSIGVTANITSGSIKYKAYAVYQNGSQLITVYSDTNTYTFS